MAVFYAVYGFDSASSMGVSVCFSSELLSVDENKGH
jgi:hypothetical protein